MKITRRAVLGGLATGLVAYPSLRAQAKEDWPARPIKLISPYGPGGANDISLRLLADRLEQETSLKFFVENRPGGGTRIANAAVARAEPDGYTFLYAAAPYATAEALAGKLSYDPRKDLVPVAMAVVAPIFLIVNAHAPYKTLDAFIAYGKSKPDGLTFGSPGAGSQPHLAAELLFKDAGVKGLNVQFRGDAPAYTELLAGRIDATLTAISAALPHIESGGLRVLGCASAQRSAVYPQAPTLREQGRNVVAEGWYGFMAPAGTPAAILDRMQTEILRVLAETEMQKKLVVRGLEARGGTGAAFGAFIEDETRKWSAIIREAGIKEG
ncbi:Bug family tripartite tricarboxylate transporter substrate binding protein [Aquabacter spiritensis]|uniref:Tripartite-type tricarboxylate transporter receptor subunit TctC n=1 Tax=Aquabacter spiritensis TaxID=933073 RepID=A0A4R3LK05_9HYPH|nr:tripartite tricarboxylate transporter substrate binding protein [Aquabacter spiritensis]TCT00514.1 tripartite-type tricarboxylate transporter receptor subunit TctC [Aquabacter spiritensis]